MRLSLMAIGNTWKGSWTWVEVVYISVLFRCRGIDESTCSLLPSYCDDIPKLHCEGWLRIGSWSLPRRFQDLLPTFVDRPEWDVYSRTLLRLHKLSLTFNHAHSSMFIYRQWAQCQDMRHKTRSDLASLPNFRHKNSKASSPGSSRILKLLYTAPCL